MIDVLLVYTWLSLSVLLLSDVIAQHHSDVDMMKLNEMKFVKQ